MIQKYSGHYDTIPSTGPCSTHGVTTNENSTSSTTNTSHSTNSSNGSSSSCYPAINEQTPLLLRQRSIDSLSTTQEADQRRKEDEDNTVYFSFTDYIEQCSLSVYLENKGSVARDHLANERTYLAWLRTSLSLISVGVALTQLFRLDKSSTTHPSPPKNQFQELVRSGRLVGLMFIIFGMLFVLFAVSRFFHAQQAMIKGYFPASRGIVMVASSLVCISVIILFIIIIQ